MTGTTDVTITSFVVDSGTELLVLAVATYDTTGDAPVDATLDPGGGNETAFSVALIESTNARSSCAFFYIVNPPSGTFDVECTFGGATIATAIAFAYNFENIDTSSPIGDTDSADTSNADNMSLSITTTYRVPLIMGIWTMFSTDTIGWDSPMIEDRDQLITDTIMGIALDATEAIPSTAVTVSCSTDGGDNDAFSCGAAIEIVGP